MTLSHSQKKRFCMNKRWSLLHMEHITPFAGSFAKKYIRIAAKTVFWGHGKKVRRTIDFKISCDALHGVCVDLAHVPSLVRGLNVLEVDGPLFALRLRHGESVVSGDHLVVHGQDRLCVHTQPSDLKMCLLKRLNWKGRWSKKGLKQRC